MKVKNTKSIAYLVKHLEKKWRAVLEKINKHRTSSHYYQFRIYPRQDNLTLTIHEGWGRDDDSITLQQIHLELLAPNVSLFCLSIL